MQPRPTTGGLEYPAYPSSRVGVLLALNLVALGGAATACIAATKVANHDAWWTYLPASISALVTSFAFIVTFLLFRRGSGDRRREQAASVYAWARQTPLAGGGVKVEATVYNRSDTPIWRVEVRPLRSGRNYADHVLQHHPDIAPGESETWSWDLSPGDAAATDRHVALTFDDSADRRWRKVGSQATEVRRRRFRRLGGSRSV